MDWTGGLMNIFECSIPSVHGSQFFGGFFWFFFPQRGLRM